MPTPPIAVSTRIGESASRIDGRLRVTGAARYGADFAVSQPAYAHLRTSSIAVGEIADIDESEARSLPGVLDIFTYKSVGTAIKPGNTFDKKGQMESSIAPLESNKIHYAGQIVAMVVAEYLEVARDAARRLKVTYRERPASATFGEPGLEVMQQAKLPPGALEDPKIGDAESAFASSPVKLQARYATPTQHHNPIELYSTTCAWNDSKLTVWESNRNVTGYRFGLATQLGISPEDIHIIAPFIGGAFGSRGFLNQRTAIVCLAAKRLKRPVKLEVTRAQMFSIAAFRAETQQEVELGATRGGKLLSVNHKGWEITSRPDTYRVGGPEVSTRIYACRNISSTEFIVRADRNTPGFMRSPPETPYLFAMESAMDELSYELDMDPIELRRINDTKIDPIHGLPITSRHLFECYDAAAKAFDWSKRDPKPRSMRDGDWLIGYGCATATHASQAAPATARVTLTSQATVKVQAGAHDVGGGLYTAVAIAASDRLGIPLERITVELGDSDLPPSPLAGGSVSTTSVCNVVADACEMIRTRISVAATSSSDGPFHGLDPSSLLLRHGALCGADSKSEPIKRAIMRVTPGALEAYAEFLPHGAPPDALQSLYQGVSILVGGVRLKDRVQCSYGANLVELRIHVRTKEVRVHRIVGAYSFGTVMNPKTAKSQLMGAQIFGISAALHEATDIDKRFARYTNDNFAEYLIPVNADIPHHEAIIIPEEDPVINKLGLKGVGELGNCGMNAAVANAVYHATGVRVRKLPIRLEALL